VARAWYVSGGFTTDRPVMTSSRMTRGETTASTGSSAESSKDVGGKGEGHRDTPSLAD